MPHPKAIPILKKSDCQAVSPVIATILMVAITVVLSAVLMVMVMGMVSSTDGGGEGVTPPLAMGSGTVSDPYLLRSIDEVMNIVTDRDGNYALASNIDASSTRFMNDGKGFEPMFPFGTSFRGSFDGQSYVITGLYINRPKNNTIGFFGAIIDGAVVKNITLINVEIIGGDTVGGLAGRSTGSVENCHVSGSVTGKNDVGGLIGTNWRTVSKCSSTATVSATGDNIGGLIGLARKGVGNAISNSYATGSVTGRNNVSGFVGGNGVAGSGTTTVTNCYSTGLVSGTTLVGGLIGSNSGTVTYSFWDTVTSGKATSAAGTGLTTAQMKNPATFTSAGWSSDTWILRSGYYPELRCK